MTHLTIAELKSKMILMNGKFLTLKEVAKRLRVSERSIYRYIKTRKLNATKIGYWRINEKDLIKFIKESSNSKKS